MMCKWDLLGVVFIQLISFGLCAQCSIESGLLAFFGDDSITRTWDEANTWCGETYGTELAAIHSSEDVNRVVALYNECKDTFGLGDASPWIGGRWDSQNGGSCVNNRINWLWMDSSEWGDFEKTTDYWITNGDTSATHCDE